MDANQAFKWYSLAAEKGDAKAQSNVAAFYLNGVGGAPKDPGKAYMWLKLSESQGEVTATNLLKEADAILSPEDVIRGKKLLTDYLSTPRARGPAAVDTN